MSSETLHARLKELAQLGSLPKSACSVSFRDFIRPLLDAEVIMEQKSGAGRQFTVRNAAALLGFISQRFPHAEVPENAPNRLAAVARFRDTKALRSNVPDTIRIRGWRDDVLKAGDQFVPLTQATEDHGIFSFVLRESKPVSLHGPCALVENPTVFYAFESLGLDVSLVIYGQGRLSNRALEWLVAQDDPQFKILHLPDYDPVGLSEFERLRVGLGERADLFVPSNVAKLFARFANPKLLLNPTAQILLNRLRGSSTPGIQHVAELIAQHNGGLEQETLLLSD